MINMKKLVRTACETKRLLVEEKLQYCSPLKILWSPPKKYQTDVGDCVFCLDCCRPTVLATIHFANDRNFVTF